MTKLNGEGGNHSQLAWDSYWVMISCIDLPWWFPWVHRASSYRAISSHSYHFREIDVLYAIIFFVLEEIKQLTDLLLMCSLSCARYVLFNLHKPTKNYYFVISFLPDSSNCRKSLAPHSPVSPKKSRKCSKVSRLLWCLDARSW